MGLRVDERTSGSNTIEKYEYNHLGEVTEIRDGIGVTVNFAASGEE
jgi:hypothetical protein